MIETVKCEIEVVKVLRGDIYFKITCGEQSVTIDVDEVYDAMPSIMRWLEAIAIGVQECGVTIEEPGSGMRLYYEWNGWLEVGSPYSRDENVLRASIDPRQMVQEFYSKLFRDIGESPAYLKEEWEAESVGERLLAHFSNIGNDDDLLDLLLSYNRGELEDLLNKLAPGYLERWGQSEEQIISDNDRELLNLDEFYAAVRARRKLEQENDEVGQDWILPEAFDAAPAETRKNYLIWGLGFRNSDWSGCKLSHVRSEIIENFLKEQNRPKHGIHTDKCYYCGRYGDPKSCTLHKPATTKAGA